MKNHYYELYWESLLRINIHNIPEIYYEEWQHMTTINSHRTNGDNKKINIWTNIYGEDTYKVGRPR